MEGRALTLVLGKQRQVQPCKFETSLGYYIVSQPGLPRETLSQNQIHTVLPSTLAREVSSARRSSECRLRAGLNAETEQQLQALLQIRYLYLPTHRPRPMDILEAGLGRTWEPKGGGGKL